ncbi:1,4-dihydroxy-2-naphthoate polyprenyltransferase [Elioraea thermophila]|uniref:1,4-dihydroxy-2-naphthoate polyprenyltransferase n=1 Tax=Elioraea thermophila TaxID=2185104 RepID=UPI000DF39DDE|nr:1,4-dihydroxy-2-naphthoate polyprenyltransferase [Elioraea thermophila]
MTGPQTQSRPSARTGPAASAAPTAIPSPLAVWLYAARVRTLPASVAPVVMGIALAAADGTAHAASALAALLGALLIQIGTNFANDYSDFTNGVDHRAAGGRRRVLPEGLVTPRQMLAATVLSFGLAVLVGVFLVARGGWPIVLIGLASILAGVLYTGGPAPYGYRGLGELFVLIFFGPVAVAGTYYVQALSLDWRPIVAGLGPGFISVAILAVNNLRDIENDRARGKRTLAVMLGRGFARAEIVTAIVLAAALPVVFVLAGAAGPALLAAALVLPAAFPTVRLVLTRDDATTLDACVARTGRLLVLYAALFSVGWLL